MSEYLPNNTAAVDDETTPVESQTLEAVSPVTEPLVAEETPVKIWPNNCRSHGDTLQNLQS